MMMSESGARSAADFDGDSTRCHVEQVVSIIMIAIAGRRYCCRNTPTTSGRPDAFQSK